MQKSNDIHLKSRTSTNLNTKSIEIPADSLYKQEMKIGLLLSEHESKNELALAAKHGAELAIKQANFKSGNNQTSFKLLVRSCDGLWGAGSKEAVSFVYDDEVVALMSSLDGRNAHLAEQVATKTHTVLLSTRAGDPTLSQAYVPWFFRCVPNDNQQAAALVKEIFMKRKLGNIAVVSDNGYDGRLASNSLLQAAELAGEKFPVQFFYEKNKPDFESLVAKLEKSGTQNIVLFGEALSASRLIHKIRNRITVQSVFGSLSILGEGKGLNQTMRNFEGSILISSGHWFTAEGKTIQKEFEKTYGYLPGAVAAYAYDGMNLIIEAIRKSGPGLENLRDSLATINFTGITGVIHFDEMGNRTITPGLMEIKNGVPVPVNDNN